MMGIGWRKVLHRKIEAVYFQRHSETFVARLRRKAKNSPSAVHKGWFAGQRQVLRKDQDTFKFLAYL